MEFFLKFNLELKKKNKLNISVITDFNCSVSDRFEKLFSVYNLGHNKFYMLQELVNFGMELENINQKRFSTYSQNVFIQALNSAETTTERSKIRQNWEGSSDKYARMICGWLTNENINWVTKTRKSATVQIGNENFTEILQSYQITISGISAFRSCRAYSRNAGTVKNVYFEMLATKGTDCFVW